MAIKACQSNYLLYFLLFLEPLPNALRPIAILPNTIISNLPFYPMSPLIYLIVKITPTVYLNARGTQYKTFPAEYGINGYILNGVWDLI